MARWDKKHTPAGPAGLAAVNRAHLQFRLNILAEKNKTNSVQKVPHCPIKANIQRNCYIMRKACFREIRLL